MIYLLFALYNDPTNLLIEKMVYFLHLQTLIKGHLPHPCTGKGSEMCTLVQRLTDISCQCPYVGAFAACHPDGDIGQIACHQFDTIYNQ